MKLLLISIVLLTLGCRDTKSTEESKNDSIREADVRANLFYANRAKQKNDSIQDILIEAARAIKPAISSISYPDGSYVTTINGESGLVKKKKGYYNTAIGYSHMNDNTTGTFGVPIGETSEWVFSYPEKRFDIDTTYFYLDTSGFLSLRDRCDTLALDFLIADTTRYNDYVYAVSDSGDIHTVVGVEDYAYPVGLEKGFIVYCTNKEEQYLTRNKKPLGRNIIVIK